MFSREENNVPKNKDYPLLYFLASISIVMQAGYRLSMLVRSHWRSSSPLICWHWFRVSLHKNFPTQLEIIAATENKTNFFVFHHRLLHSLTRKLIYMCGIFGCCKSSLRVTFHRALVLQNKILPKILGMKYLSEENYQLYDNYFSPH